MTRQLVHPRIGSRIVELLEWLIVQALNINRELVKGGEPQEIQRCIEFIKNTLMAARMQRSTPT